MMLRGIRYSTLRRACHLMVVGALLCSTVGLQADRFTLLPSARPTGKLAQALDLIARGQLRPAETLLQEIIEKEPGQIYAALAQVQIAVTERRMDAADKAITAILRREPARPEVYNMRGVVAMLQKQPDAARQAFVRAIELRPTYVTPMVYLAALERSGGNYEQAAAAYKRLIVAAPRLPAGYLGAAEAQIVMNKPSDAFATLETWRRADPRSTLPPLVIANVLLSRGDAAKAVAELKASLVSHPGDAGTLTGLGAAYSVAGDNRAAAAQFEAALAIDAKYVDAMLGLGDLEAKTGATDRALAQYRRALALHPGHPIASNNVAWVLAERGQNLAEALKLAKQAAAADPTYVDAQDTLGWVLYRRNEYAAAVDALQRARTMAPGRGDIAAHLGFAYLKAGRKPDALRELKRALSTGPGLPQRADVERAVAELSTGAPALVK